MSRLWSLRVSRLPWDRHTSTSDPNAVISLSSHQEHIESRPESPDLVLVFKRDAELSLRVQRLQMEPWSQSLTLPLPPPVVVAFEAKWGVNKSNIRCIVWHPKGPSEVTLEVQITLGHGLLAFSCSISSRLMLPHSENATQPPTAAIIWFIYIWMEIDWMGPFFGIVPPQACLMFKAKTTVQHILFPKSHTRLTVGVTQNGVVASRVLSYITEVLTLLCLRSRLFSVFRLRFSSCRWTPLQ